VVLRTTNKSWPGIFLQKLNYNIADFTMRPIWYVPANPVPPNAWVPNILELDCFRFKGGDAGL
jgi:hypothetical protein